AIITKQSDGVWEISGVGVGGLHEPDTILDFGNSGTSTRLLLGCLAALEGYASITGDASLCGRPMGRVLMPLRDMGIEYLARAQDRLPLTIRGAGTELQAIDYRLPVASAQVKSCLLLAGLHCRGTTRIVEPTPTRDHTERMLIQFGAEVEVCQEGDGTQILLAGLQELQATTVYVPGDPSSAAFVIAAALIVPGSDIMVENLSLNPGRIGFLQTLQEMGADIVITPVTTIGEPAGNVRVRHSENLCGITLPASRAPSMIDEYPILAVVAAYAKGTTCMQGLAELRVKESDRLAAIMEGLLANGVLAREGDDWVEVQGGTLKGGGVVSTRLDHRIAMSFLILGLRAQESVQIDDADAIKTSFPNFVPVMEQLGCVFVTKE
ncbi:MAG: 3-phosphoshikimate 1-carboxyvinyltransferase, partial [Pseudomonadota bacterium]